MCPGPKEGYSTGLGKQESFGVGEDSRGRREEWGCRHVSKPYQSEYLQVLRLLDRLGLTHPYALDHPGPVVKQVRGAEDLDFTTVFRFQ